MRKPSPLLVPLAAALALGACQRGGGDAGNNLASLDNQLVGNDVDPALTSALADQIAVDPSLANQSNRNAVRTPETPTQAQYPAPAPGQPAARPAGAAAGDDESCSLDGPFAYDNGWANRLPAAFPVYPGGRVTEAAGYDKASCRMRVVTFTTPADWRQVADWYGAQAGRAGYSARQQVRGEDHVVAGTGQDGGSYYVIVTPKPAGSEVALVVDKGR
ncbi:MAG TPA: hypothetical protein VGD66_07745 [Allosphingosinicella sp.]|jgi:hypothetical protein